MRPGVGRVDSNIVLGDAVLADHRLGQAVGMVDVIEAEAALDAEPVVVGRPFLALDGDNAVVADLEGELAADAAIGADAFDLSVRRVGEDAVLVDEARRHQRAGRAGLHALAAGDAGRGAHRVVEIEHDLFVMAARRHADHIVDLDLAAGADTEVALDAGVELHRHRRVAAVRGRLGALREAAVGDLDLVGPEPEARLRVVRGGAHRLVADQELEDQLARGFGSLAGALHLHAGSRAANAGGGEHALALDLDHAGAAIAVGAVAGLRQPAQMRDLGAETVGDLPDRFARLRFDLGAVEGEADRLAHVKSSRKCFSTCLTGFIAAWPRPQIEASPITLVKSLSRLSSQRDWLISATAFSVPTRHGVHWPQLSSSKKRSRLSATLFMSSWSDRTTTAPDPVKQPSLSRVPKSIGRSAFDAGRMPPEAPPGR